VHRASRPSGCRYGSVGFRLRRAIPPASLRGSRRRSAQALPIANAPGWRNCRWSISRSSSAILAAIRAGNASEVAGAPVSFMCIPLMVPALVCTPRWRRCELPTPQVGKRSSTSHGAPRAIQWQRFTLAASTRPDFTPSRSAFRHDGRLPMHGVHHDLPKLTTLPGAGVRRPARGPCRCTQSPSPTTTAETALAPSRRLRRRARSMRPRRPASRHRRCLTNRPPRCRSRPLAAAAAAAAEPEVPVVAAPADAELLGRPLRAQVLLERAFFPRARSTARAATRAARPPRSRTPKARSERRAGRPTWEALNRDAAPILRSTR
jgi:hypothetical protein